MGNWHRQVIHVDMDAFYASVEQHDDPAIRGKPVVVGGTGPRGVVAAASYEVRRYGVRSAMPMATALRRCPDAICIRPRMQRYRELSRRIFAIFESFTPLVEGLSLDEAYLDVSASEDFRGGAEEIGLRIKEKIQQQTGLVASIGIGPNKLVAKIASDLDKPNGFRVITPAEVQAILDPLPVETINGIGPRTREALHRLGVRRIQDLRKAPEHRVQPVFGRLTHRIRQLASGIDDREVRPHGIAKSISSEETFEQDLATWQELRPELERLSSLTAQRVRSKGLRAGLISIKIRDAGFCTYNRQQPLHPPCSRAGDFFGIAQILLKTWCREHPDTPVRLLGVAAGELGEERQYELFGEDTLDRQDALEEVVDRVQSRFGRRSLTPGSSLR